MAKKIILPVITLSNFLIITSCMAIISLPTQKFSSTQETKQTGQISDIKNTSVIVQESVSPKSDSSPNSDTTNTNLITALSTSSSAYNNKIEELIFQKTNQERAKQNLPALKQENGLIKLAQLHSKNMATYSFFAHTDNLGLSPSDRKAKYYPELFGSIGENISYLEGYSGDEYIASEIVKGWMNSQGHKANILSTDYTHLGVGLAISGDKIYVTQDFSDAQAILLSKIPTTVNYGDSLSFKFQFIGDFDKNKLSIFAEFPDKTQKYFTSDNYFYIGFGKYEPVWNGDLFTVTIKFDKGKGIYTLRTGKDNSFYDNGLEINVQ